MEKQSDSWLVKNKFHNTLGAVGALVVLSMCWSVILFIYSALGLGTPDGLVLWPTYISTFVGNCVLWVFGVAEKFPTWGFVLIIYGAIKEAHEEILSVLVEIRQYLHQLLEEKNEKL